jgi:hydroxyacylglutathione hydrolase
MLTLCPIPVLDDNYVWVLQLPGVASVAIVDPGDGVATLAALERRELEPCAVLLTHHHADHVGGVDEIIERHEVEVYGPALESIQSVNRPVSDTHVVRIPELDLELTVIDVPGHTAGHVAYLGPGFVLSGDTLFTGGCGRVFEGTPGQMYGSLQRLAGLPPSTGVYCAHEYTVANLRFALQVEPENQALQRRLASAEDLRTEDQPTVPSTIGEELQTNPFLRCHVAEVRAAAEANVGARLSDEVEVFAAVRAWKDGWRG